ncbi:MAG: ion transporter [Candidatus Promineifilaceae bacterium]|nr:ion transporter [Candidatus Promineifilaceae bacterium]
MSEQNVTPDNYMKSIGYELFIMLLSILSLLNLIIFFAPVSAVSDGVVNIMDGFVTIFFMLDFLFRFLTAASKKDYFLRHGGWADLLSSVPVGQFKIFRLFRLLRVIRILRAFGWRAIVNELLHKRAGSALFLTLLMVIFVLEFGAIAIVNVESAEPGANIVDAGDGVWWTFVTITTVGYGDLYPVSESGRVIGLFVMSLGVATFGVLTGFLANAFLPSDSKMDKQPDTGSGDELAELKQLLDEHERLNAALRLKVAGLEGKMQMQGAGGQGA